MMGIGLALAGIVDHWAVRLFGIAMIVVGACAAWSIRSDFRDEWSKD